MSIMTSWLIFRSPQAVVIPGQAVVPACQIPPVTEFQGIKIPTPCFMAPLWP